MTSSRCRSRSSSSACCSSGVIIFPLIKFLTVLIFRIGLNRERAAELNCERKGDHSV